VLGLVLLLALSWWPGEAQTSKRCSATRKLRLLNAGVNFNVTAYQTSPLLSAQATCADGSAGGFYLDEGVDTESNSDFIIWLGDGPICSGTECDDLCDGTTQGEEDIGVCEDASDDLLGDVEILESAFDEAQARCLYSRVVCTSTWWSEFAEITPQTVLCHDLQPFAQYTRVFIPSCSLDMFLGSGNLDPSNSEGPNKASRFRGRLLLQKYLLELSYTFNLTYAENVVFGGTRNAAIGVLNLLPFLKQTLADIHTEINPADSGRTRSVSAILDSAWFVNAEKFTPTSGDPENVFAIDKRLSNQTRDWIQGAVLNPICEERWNLSTATLADPDLRYRCLFTKEVLAGLPNDRLFFVQSQYDLLQLESLGLLENEARDEYFDSASYVSAAISYVEGYGSVVRADIEKVAAVNGDADEHYFFVTPCGQHGYIVPTSIHSVPPREETISEFGSVRFQRDFEVWEALSLGGVNVREAIADFLNGETTIGTGAVSNALIDNSCGTFLCNPQCTTRVRSFVIEPLFSRCLQFMTLGYGSATMAILYIAFFFSYRQVRSFRRYVRAYWKRIETLSKNNRMGGIQEVQEQLLNEASSAEYRKIHIMVTNFSYWAPARSRRGKSYRILSNVDLAFAPGRVHAVMGPSGSGKSTLLDLLALKRESGIVSGAHYVNGIPTGDKATKFLREHLSHSASYVRQTDVFFPYITVREHLVHAAWLTLPQFMPSEAKMRRVWQVMRILELEGCADTICGDGGIAVEGGISGGQRRRLSVATQLLKLPAVLVLDEPTSGLDSTNALLLIKSLHIMAHEAGVNVLLTIHQPRREIFDFFDSLSFLVAGRVVFSGLPQEAANHFGIPSTTNNLANDVLDLLQDISPEEASDLERKYLTGALGEAVKEEIDYERADLSSEQIKSLKEILVENALAQGQWSYSETSSSATLAWVHMSRSMIRGGFDLIPTVGLSLFGGLVAGVVFLGVNTYTSRTALVYLIIGTLMFIEGTFLGTRYLAEKQNYNHEVSAGTFSSWTAFHLNQLLRDAMTASLETIAFTVPVYWLGGLNGDIIRFAIYMLISILFGFVVLSQNVLVQIHWEDIRIHSMVQIGLLGLGALFSGFIIRLEDLPVYFSWVPYVMLTYWGFVGMLINDLSGFALPCSLESELECAARTGDVVIRSFSYDNRDVYQCILVLLSMIFIFRILCVLDFYRLYVRNHHNKLKKVSVDEAEPTLISARESEFATKSPQATPKKEKNTMNEVLDIQTPRMKKQESSNSLVTTPTFVLEDGSGKALPEFGFYDSEDAAEFSFAQKGWISLLLDRNLFLILFVVDFYSTASLCAFATGDDDDLSNPLGATAISIGFAIIYAVHFVVQLFLLTPTTLDGKLDCTWAGGYDALAGISLLLDLALTFQSFSSNSGFEVTIILAFVVRLARFIRVLLFWMKVDFYHFVRARSFLDVRDELIEEAAMRRREETESKRISGFDDGSPGGSGSKAPVRPARPDRPARPQRPARPDRPPLAARQRMSTRVVSSRFRQHPSLAARSTKMSTGSHHRTGSSRKGGSSSRSGRPPPSRPQRPIISLSRQEAPPQATDPDSQWVAAGKGYMYNSGTGQMLSMSQLARRPAPPPPPSGGAGPQPGQQASGPNLNRRPAPPPPGQQGNNGKGPSDDKGPITL